MPGRALPIPQLTRHSRDTCQQATRPVLLPWLFTIPIMPQRAATISGDLAKQGLIAFGFTNSTPAIASVGGQTPVIGATPLSFGVPGRGEQSPG
jgi:hypothetical protein